MTSAAIYGSNFTARRLNIRNSGADGIKPISNFVIENNWIHQLGYISTSHADGIQMVNGGNGIIRNNNFDMIPGGGYKNSNALMIQTNVGAINNLLIEGNWFNGGTNYLIQINDKGTGFGYPTNVRVINNWWGRDYVYGLARFSGGSPETGGNRWEDTGELITQWGL